MSPHTVTVVPSLRLHQTTPAQFPVLSRDRRSDDSSHGNQGPIRRGSTMNKILPALVAGLLLLFGVASGVSAQSTVPVIRADAPPIAGIAAPQAVSVKLIADTTA